MIIFYDGECGFCNNWVQYYLKHEKDFELKGSLPSFSPLQGNAAKKYLWADVDMNSIMIWQNGKIYTKSSAVLRIMKNMTLDYRILAKLGWIVPRCLRDKAYDVVAKRRHKLAKPFCFIPTKEQKARFLD